MNGTFKECFLAALSEIRWALWAIFVAIMMNTCATQAAHAQASLIAVPPGCYTSFEDDFLCWEPKEDYVWQAYYDDLDFSVQQYGFVAGGLINLYVKQGQKLAKWKRLARERARRIVELRNLKR